MRCSRSSVCFANTVSVLKLPSHALVALCALCAPQHFAAISVDHLIIPVLGFTAASKAAEWHFPNSAHMMQVIAPPKRSNTPTNVVYPVLTPSIPVDIPLYNTPVLSGPAAVTTVARETVVSETVAPAETAVEAEDGKVSLIRLAGAAADVSLSC